MTTTYPVKITFGEMRASGVRDVVIYCRDHPATNRRWGILDADSCPSRPSKRDDVARRNGMMPPTITR